VDEITAKGGKAALVLGDVSQKDEANAVADAAMETFGGVDVLVNNAGESSGQDSKSWFQMPLEEWEKTYQKMC
jgi:3-oxoacyl-[acyl-carrier protein] reductase